MMSNVMSNKQKRNQLFRDAETLRKQAKALYKKGMDISAMALELHADAYEIQAIKMKVD